MVEVVVASNPRRVRRIIIGGKLYEGGIEEAYASKSMGNDLGGVGSPNQASGGTKEASQENASA